MRKKFTVFVEDYNVPLNAWSVLQENIFSKDIPKMTNDEVNIDNMLWYEKDFVVWGVNKDQFAQASNFFMAKIKEDPNFLIRTSERQEQEIWDFKKMLDELKEIDLTKKTNSELFEIYDQIRGKFVETWVDGFVILLMEMGPVKYSEKVRQKLYKKLRKIDSKYPKTVFSRLISPDEETFLKRESMSVLELLSEVKRDQSLHDKIQAVNEFNELPKGFQKKLEKLSNEFGWLQYYYLGPAASPKYYFDLVKRRIHIDAEKELKRIKEDDDALLKFQEKAKKFFSEIEWQEIESLKKASYLKELRKDLHQYYRNSVMEKWHREVGKRFYLSYLQTRYILYDEFKQMLLNGKKISADTLNERYRCCSIIWRDKKLEVFSGEEALKSRKLIEDTKIDVNLNEIKGSVAYPGKVRANVKIVNSVSDMVKFNEGDILASYSTNPSLVPAMNKASAIITDSGGITCHAAIVARELKLPCIINTKIATKVLKDGDLIEVDANKGRIKIIREENMNPLEIDWEQKSVRQRMSPFPNYLSMEAICSLMKETFGFNYETVLLTFEKNLMKVLVTKSDLINLAEKSYSVLLKEPSILERMIKEVDEIGGPFIDQLKLIPDNLTTCSNEELANYFLAYEKEYKKIYHRYFFIVTAEPKILENLSEILKKRNLDDDLYEKLFVTLTTEPEAMVNFREERSRFVLVEKILKNENWLLFLKTNCSSADIFNYPKLGELIKNHYEEFFWITRDYEDPIIEIDDMIKRIRKTIDSKEDFGQLKDKVIEFDNHLNSIKEAEKKLKLTSLEGNLFKAMRDGIYLKERRKEYVSKSLFYFDKVLREVANRTGSSMRLVRFLKMNEVFYFLEGSISEETIEERYERSCWVADKEGAEVLQNGKADEIFAKLFSNEDITELKGQPISSGIVTGRAKIMMNPEDGDNIENGDIIVTVQAVPSFSPAISRAAGIIADGGTGLTSHTATLAREAKIPGITNLKFATQSIRDGDTIEVDGTRGTVKIIMRKD